MPLAKRVCFLPWQSRFIETHELMLTVTRAMKPSAKNNFFIKTLTVKKDGLVGSKR